MPTGQPIPDDVQQAMVDAYLSGQSCRQAAAPFGLSIGACVRALKLRGVARREQTDAQRQYPVNDAYFASVDTVAKAYWLGFITADGCVASASNNLSIGLARCDRDHLAKFNAAIGSERPVLDYEAMSKGAMRSFSRATITSSRVVQDLACVGITPRKTFSVEAWRGPEALMVPYWRGVFDGDGAIFKARRRSTYKEREYEADHWSLELVGSYSMMMGFAAFLDDRLGIRHPPERMQKIRRVRVGGVDLPRQVATLLYDGNGPSLDRKQMLADELMDVEPKRRCLRNMTAAQMMDLYAECGRNWTEVAARLNMHRRNLHAFRRRLGVLLYP